MDTIVINMKISVIYLVVFLPDFLSALSVHYAITGVPSTIPCMTETHAIHVLTNILILALQIFLHKCYCTASYGIVSAGLT